MIKVYRNSIEFIIPDHSKDGAEVNPSMVLDALSQEIGSIKLGMGQSDQIGIWVEEGREPMSEGNLLLRVSFPDELWHEIIAVIMRFAALGASDLNQAELAININGTFITASTELSSDREELSMPNRIQKGLAVSRKANTFSHISIKG